MVFLLRLIVNCIHPLAFLAVASFVLASCSATKFLEDDELLLQDNKVKIIGKARNKNDLTYDLSTLARQQPNASFLFIPREAIYVRGEKARNPESSYNRWRRNSLGEPPVLYQDSLTQATVRDMELYLRFNGYWRAKVLASAKASGKNIYVTYRAQLDTLFEIGNVYYQVEDARMDSILEANREDSFLEPNTGTPLDLQLYNQERERITRLFRNNGYAYFSNSYFDNLEIDSLDQSTVVDLYVNINSQGPEEVYRVYRVGAVNIFPNYQPLLDSATQRNPYDTIYENGIHFIYEVGKDTVLKRSALLINTFLQPDSVYHQEDYDKTNQQLGGLGIYQFVRIKQYVDSLQPDVLNFDIQLTPNERMEIGADFDINYTNRSATTGAGNLIGFSVGPNFRNRNWNRGAELLVATASAGVEVNPNVSGQRFWNTIDLRTTIDLYLPRFVDYLSLYRSLYNIPIGKDKHLLDEDFYTALRENSATRFSLGYEYLLILDYYSYSLFNARYGYEFQKSATSRYAINHIGIDLLLPQPDSLFQDILNTNPFLENSFGQQVFVSLVFRDFDYTRNSRVNRKGQSYFLNSRLEMAGAEIWAANQIYNRFATEDAVFRLGRNTNFSQYILSEIDFRVYDQINQGRNWAARLNFGIGRPFGDTTEVPYVKQFYVGGPNSIRAFAPRGLGPGGFLDTLSLDRANAFRLYQTGDIKLEFNLEYRFDLFWFTKGAIFLDAGNVWTFRRDLDRCGSQFLWQEETYVCGEETFTHYPFYRQIAIGGGMGLRFDLSYFIFRLDLAVPLRFNYPSTRNNPREADWWNDFRNFQLQDIRFNLGLGYPF